MGIRSNRAGIGVAAILGAVAISIGGVPAGATASTAPADGPDISTMGADGAARAALPGATRFATFNASLNRQTEGGLLADLSTPDDPQAAQIAEVLQRNRPDVVLLNEFDHVEGGAAVTAFQQNYLSVSQQGARPIEYPYSFIAPVNTGVPSGLDLNRDGEVGGPDDALGFGEFPGQYGMVVLSRHPIDLDGVRTFQNFRWQDMPGALLPDDVDTPEPADWYSPEALDLLPLSSKSHWDLPIRIGSEPVHFLVSHPTPPAFDGPEGRNRLRNHDEIRFWADYVTPGRGDYAYDDQGGRGGLADGAAFVIAGDQNADPMDGDGEPGAIARLLNTPTLIDPWPGSLGAIRAAWDQGGANREHRGLSWFDTADFNDESPGNLRVDYVLPSRQLIPVGSGVFWPIPESALSRLNSASDHHLVWVDVFGKRR
ncbi:endonuclease/exonuclease/phosphatase family protein [Actinoalloteichus hymeniacidonis]|uniref:Endonuclease/exonuclease/phosphatase family protein n=2 Tax=Actinoalloteichus hymeniacidonis TaxID=340345 RepID=A0AAC9HKJ5_9PSEU|nr:endonuclease/exonuclease/phosphatase family protein [Actinoalloteichus hymeniacidonis]